MTRAAIQLPPLSPSAPVRTQVFQPGRPGGRRLAAAYGPRVGGPDPVDNAGERRIPRGGSPQESGIRCGQRPSVHRLQRCRGPKGPRASGAAATCPRQEIPRVQHHGLAAGTDTRGPDRRGTPLQQMISHRGGCRAQGDTHTSTGKRIHQAGKVCRERRHFVPSLHILSDHRWGDATRAIVPCPERISIVHDLLCTWSVHGALPIVSGPFLLRKSGHPPPA
jgi:hypothetical protein